MVQGLTFLVMGSAKHITEVTFEKESLLGTVKRGWKTVRLRAALGHVGLLMALMLYTAGGGMASTRNLA